MPVNPLPQYSSQASMPFRSVVPVTLANSDLPDGVCRGLIVGTAGTVNIMDAGGDIRTGIPVQAGINPIMCLQVRTGGSAANIWAGY